MAFFLLSSPDLGSGPGIGVPQAAAAREEQARLERVCGISRGPGCCTLPKCLGSGFRIMLLNSGAKGTRTPDPLLANNRQHVHHCPSQQVTVPGCPSVSLCIRSCCGTSVLYFPGRPPASVPVAILRCRAGSRSSPHLPGRTVQAACTPSSTDRRSTASASRHPTPSLPHGKCGGTANCSRFVSAYSRDDGSFAHLRRVRLV